MMKRRICVVLLLCVAAISAPAQELAKLTFEEAVKTGLKNNLTLSQQRNQLIFTEVSKKSGLLRMAPTVSASASAGRFDGNSFNQQLGQVINGQTDFVNGNISAEVPVFNGFNQVNGYRQTVNQNDAQLNLVKRTEQDIIRNIANQYLTCLLDQQLVKIDQQNVETQATQLSQIKAQAELGARAEADVFNQEYQLRNAELLLVRSTNRLKNDKAILAQTLLIDPITFELEEVSWDVDAPDAITLDELNTQAQQFRSDLKQASFSEKAAQFGLMSNRARYYPNLTAFAQMNSRYNYIYDYPDNRPFEQQFRTDNRQLYYGLSLSIPILNGFISRTQVAQARVTFENAKINTKSTEVRVKTEVLLAHQNYADARTSFQASDAQLKAAELSYKTEKERYDLGISNIVQLTTAQQAFVRAQSDFANARYTLMFQKIMINYAIGTLKVDDIPK